MLQALGSVQNLVSENTILDISQSISRVALRSDGCVPTLTTTCGNLFVPSRAVALDHKQLLALQGICPDLAAAVECTPEQICKMAGNAMTLPLVGSVLVAALSQLIPQKGSVVLLNCCPEGRLCRCPRVTGSNLLR